MRDTLVILADKLDQEGKHDLASAVDEVILSKATRNKAPLKDLSEDVKKDLLKFLYVVGKNLEDSTASLDEFFRRLRYFDIGDSIRDLGLDKVFREMQKTKSYVDNARRSMYTMAYGRKPSRNDMQQMADDFGLNTELESNPLEFFKSQQPQDDDNDVDAAKQDFKEEVDETFEDEELDAELPFKDEMDDDEEKDVDELDMSYFWDEESDDTE